MVSFGFLFLVWCTKLNVIYKVSDGMNLGLDFASLNNNVKNLNCLRNLDSIVEKQFLQSNCNHDGRQCRSINEKGQSCNEEQVLF